VSRTSLTRSLRLIKTPSPSRVFTDAMDAFKDAFARLELADRELEAAEAAFERGVYLFLVGKAGPPGQQLAEQVCACRAAAVAAVRALRAMLEHCRVFIRVI
jgi:hypothetical protein